MERKKLIKEINIDLEEMIYETEKKEENIWLIENSSNIVPIGQIFLNWIRF